MSRLAKDDLLIEVGTEELPPRALANLSKAFAEAVSRHLSEAKLDFGTAEAYASPRRLSVIIRGLSRVQPDETLVRRGPTVAAAFDQQGKPTKAALGFAQSCGVAVEALGREETEKGTWLRYEHLVRGAETLRLLPTLAERALNNLPIPKRMRWGSSSVEFVRPVHWVCMLLGSDVVPGTLLGFPIDRLTYGHRFHHPGAISLAEPSAYLDALRGAKVEADSEIRRASIRAQVEELAEEVRGRAAIDEGVLAEVTALCEWPVAVLGQFDADFLEVPPEVLIETMQANQKYFPVFDAGGQLLPWFVTVSNIESREPEQVRAGNERVIRPRFADAKFFWVQDRKRTLASRSSALDSIVFQHQLGSLRAKSERMAELSGWIAAQIGCDLKQTERAARLSKCDLVTQMVGEFGSLQGLMGRYYAEHDGEEVAVCEAIEQHYWPKHAGDRLPEADVGRAVALADRLDTLVGIFAIGQRPSGVKDPYGLRRAAIGVLRILIETPLQLDLKDLLIQAAKGYAGSPIDARGAVEAVLDYCLERLKSYYSDADSARAVDADVIASVLALGCTEPFDIDRRIRAVQQFRGQPAAASLAAANKRTRNILRKASANEIGERIDLQCLRDASERTLVGQINAIAEAVERQRQAREYDAVLRELSELRGSLDHFFDEVMVMAEEPELRANRLAILRRLEQMFLGVADISLLQA